MPYKDKEKQRQYHKKYNKEHIDETRERSRKYYKKHKEKILQNHKQWNEQNYKQFYQKHRQQIIQCSKQYYENNKERALQRRRQYYQSNQKNILQYHKKYRENHKKISSQYNKQYRQTEQGKEIIRQNRDKRRKLGSVALNKKFPNSHFHHINNKEGVYIPEAIHKLCFTGKSNRKTHRRKVLQYYGSLEKMIANARQLTLVYD